MKVEGGYLIISGNWIFSNNFFSPSTLCFFNTFLLGIKKSVMKSGDRRQLALEEQASLAIVAGCFI